MTGLLGVGPLRVGTRASALALTQTEQVGAALTALGQPVEVVRISSRGDVDSSPLVDLAGRMSGAGIFTSALRDALLAGEIDLAVHSLKDLPVQTPEGLVLAAVPARADAADLLVTLDGRGLADLPAGARIGTGSPRRAALLRAARPDVEVVPVRGNVDTRLRLLEGGNGRGRLDAVVLAAAGLSRLGRAVRAERLVAPVMLPAPGQGALAVEMRAGDPAVAKVAGLDDVQTRRCVCAERAVLARLGAGCTAAVAALAVPAAAEQGRLARGTPDPDQARLALRAVVLAVDGSRRSSAEAVGPAAEPEQLGAEVGDQLLAAGAAELLTDVHGPPWQPSPELQEPADVPPQSRETNPAH
jgi:hydroxymethylbilane synthase